MGVQGNRRETVEQMDCNHKMRMCGDGEGLIRLRNLVSSNGLCKDRVKGFEEGEGRKGRRELTLLKRIMHPLPPPPNNQVLEWGREEQPVEQHYDPLGCEAVASW